MNQHPSTREPEHPENPSRSARLYFLLAFAISWGGIFGVVGGLGGFHGVRAENDPLFPLVYLAMLAGPSIAGILMTILIGGKAGLRELLSRLLMWRLGARWYVVALLTAPFVVATTLFALSLTSPVFLPGILASDDKVSRLLFAIAVGLGAGVFEELGWTGFAVPRLLRRRGVLATGLIVGLLWSVWHILAVVWGIGDRAGAVPLALFVALDLFSGLPAFRMLMVWVYERTGSLFLAMLMHASLTTSLLILAPATTGMSLLIFDFALAAALWAIVAATAVARGGRLSRHLLPKQAA